ncbi:hypothetical protein HYPSUDRAFT_155771 [Hypholoma sublateritium FD-334 SS-4]|uniref:SAP domain-containing protein n=1 Tax=Hypholoma sublateritium (strain FD-334 SS-4) TaxID=945553 RepID=A0A0D2PC82_HYPSF|nr:hypothetical protein HYPSUDRAFT_155771 [Hypholoma sublateritium FD-334 SS-4]
MTDSSNTANHQDAPMDVDEQGGCLPFPGEMMDTGVWQDQYLNIEQANKTKLQEWCRGFGLPSSGNKDVLHRRLRDFSGDKAKWASVVPRAKRMHRGPQTGRISKGKRSKTQSARRADAVFSNRVVQPLAHPPNKLPILAPMQNPNERQEILAWADNVVHERPYLNKEQRLKAAQARLQKNTAKVNLTGSQLAEIVAGMITGATAAQESLPPKSPPETNRNSESTTDADDDGVPTTRSVTLGNGTIVSFTADDVPPPPAISFASREDISLLNRMWDDTSPFWGGLSVLEIKGVPIPIIYWKAVYSQRMKGRNGRGDPTWKPRQWKAVKGHYFNWRTIVERLRQGSESDFWHEFCEEKTGKPMTYTAIIGKLASIRKREDSRLVEEAHKAYPGSKFADEFKYKKNGICYVKTKASEIAKHYRRLLGISDDVDSDME